MIPETVFGIFKLIFFLFVYFLPTFIAFMRGHNERLVIFVLNIFAGIGHVIGGVFWILLILWASLNDLGSTKQQHDNAEDEEGEEGGEEEDHRVNVETS